MKPIPLTWAHYEICYRLFQEIFERCEYDNFRASWKSRNPSACYVMMRAGALLGFILTTQDNCIQYIVVSSKHQGEGIGSALLKKVLENLQDAPSVWLKTADDPRLAKWYEKYGFKPDHTYLAEDKTYLGTCMVKLQRGRRQTTRFSQECTLQALVEE